VLPSPLVYSLLATGSSWRLPIAHPLLHPDAYARALDARDPRFDGVFFVGITTTRVYCRPVCPARVAYQDHRRFFNSAAAAESAGFRPCLRCRPELAPGHALCDAVSRLARMATQRISAGGLNGRRVADLAGELGVSGRHLRRALEREIGVSPLELAQTHRLLLAKRLLVDTGLPVTRVAYASGFQSLRRFNAAFREQYRMAPTALRRRPETRRPAPGPEGESIRFTLAYRAPFAWDALLAFLGGEATPGVQWVAGHKYGRTVRIENHTGFVLAWDAPPRPRPSGHASDTHVVVEVSASLIHVLMPLIARLRRVFDLDAEPTVVDAHLEQGGLGALVAKRPGIRVPGAFDGFETALRMLLSGPLAARLTQAFGEPIATGIPGLTHITPTAAQIAEAGGARLEALGVPSRRAASIIALASAVTNGGLWLEPGGDLEGMQRGLREIDGIGERLATAIPMRTLYWPDAFPATDRALQRAAGVASAGALLAKAERWHPWRAYAALHLWLEAAGRGSTFYHHDSPPGH
jgi:AraC family transcriptional regulator of adaptative response / DNA-3-methyladenine glycosylase II